MVYLASHLVALQGGAPTLRIPGRIESSPVSRSSRPQDAETQVVSLTYSACGALKFVESGEFCCLKNATLYTMLEISYFICRIASMTAHQLQGPMSSQPPQRYRSSPRHPAPPPANASPARVSNLRKLIAACTSEAIAARLDLTVSRLEELLQGINFGDEVAYHMESMLELRSGYMDQAGAPLSQAEIDSLRAVCRKPPDDYAQHQETERSAPVVAAVPPAMAPTQAPAQAELLDAAPPAPAPAPAPVPRVQAAMPAPSVPTPVTMFTISTPSESTMPKAKATPKAAAAPADTPLTPEERLRLVRRANFALLLDGVAGAKTRLAELTSLTPTNISHRLHGHKIFDKETGKYFCSVLRLPEDWFEVPRQASEVPVLTTQLLRGEVQPSVTPPPPAKQPRSTSKTLSLLSGGQPLAPTLTQVSTAPLNLNAVTRGPGVAAPAPVAVAPAPALAPLPAASLQALPGIASVQGASPMLQAFLMVLTAKAASHDVSDEKALHLMELLVRP